MLWGPWRRVAGPALRAGIPLAAAMLLCPGIASAATLTVTTTDDVSATECTLRDAITAANVNMTFGACAVAGSGDDVIDITATGTINLTNSLPPVNSNITINGPGVSQLDVHRQSGGDFRIFSVNASKVAEISDLTVSNGMLTTIGLAGAGIANFGTLTLDRVAVMNNHVSNASDSGTAGGGGIFNGGTLTLRRSTVSGNIVSHGSSGSGQTGIDATGAGIYNTGTLMVERSTVSGNTAAASVSSVNPSSYAFAAGGGIRNFNILDLRLSTVSGNAVTAGAPVPASRITRGGGIYNSFGTMTATSSTIAFNSGALSANLSAQATETLTNTIVSNPDGGPNCDGSIDQDDGFNLESPAGCSGLAGANHSDPLLQPLAEYGGPTRTHGLAPTSPALDQGTADGDATDQRGLTRPVDLASIANGAGGDGSDIGALEAQDGDGDGVIDGSDSCPVLAGGGNPSGCPGAPRTLTLSYSAKRERFTGKLAAPDAPACAADRLVSVWRKAEGPDKEIGAKATKPNGTYALSKHARPGRYYSTADEETLADVADCEAARSPSVRVR